MNSVDFNIKKYLPYQTIKKVIYHRKFRSGCDHCSYGHKVMTKVKLVDNTCKKIYRWSGCLTYSSCEEDSFDSCNYSEVTSSSD